MAHIERGGLRVLVEELDTKMDQLLLGGVYYSVDAADQEGVPDKDHVFVVKLYESGGTPLPVANVTNAGSWKIYRIRAGTTLQIGSAAVPLVGIGRVYAEYDFPAASWETGDLFYVLFTDIEYEEGAETKAVPSQILWGRIVADYTVSDVYNTLVAAETNLDGDIAAVKTVVDSVEGKVDIIDPLVDAIKVKTDGLNYTGTDVKATLDGETVTPGAGTITSSVLAANAIGATQVATGAITADKVAANAITDTKIASNAITAAKIASGAITTAKFAAGAITNTVLAAGSIDADRLSTGAVTKIQNGLAVPADVETSLNAAVANTPTAKSLRDILNKNASGTYSRATDSLEAIRDRMEDVLGTGWSTESVVTLAAMLDQTNTLLKEASFYYSTVLGSGGVDGATATYSAAVEEGGAYAGIGGLTGATIKAPVEIITVILYPTTSSNISITITLQYKDVFNVWRDVSGWTQTWAQSEFAATKAQLLSYPPLTVGGSTNHIRGLRFKFTPSGVPDTDVNWAIQTILRHRLTLS